MRPSRGLSRVARAVVVAIVIIGRTVAVMQVMAHMARWMSGAVQISQASR